MSLQGARQQSVRDITGTSFDYGGDLRSLFELEATIPAASNWNEACLIWINDRLGASFDSLPGAQQAFAESLGYPRWDLIAAFTPDAPADTGAFSSAFSTAFDALDAGPPGEFDGGFSEDFD